MLRLHLFFWKATSSWVTKSLKIQGRQHRGGGRGRPWLSTFLRRKKTKEDKGKKEKVSKQKLLKGGHQGQNIIVLPILECLEFEDFSCPPTMVADNTFQCSMAPATLKSILPALKSNQHWGLLFINQISVILLIYGGKYCKINIC